MTRRNQLLIVGLVSLLAVSVPAPARSAQLVGWWPFEGSADDVTGNFGPTMLTGAAISHGRLEVSAATNSYARTGAYTGPTLAAKTLVTWVYLDSLTDKAGTALTVEKQSGTMFDGVVYAERQDLTWMAGSDNFLRTEDPPQQGTAETSDPATLIKMAVVYAADNSIAIYRNDVLYSSYTKGTLQSFPGGADTDVIFGLRHAAATSPNRYLTGRIEEARLYSGALSAAEITALTPVICDDGNPCTADSYDPVHDVCTHTNATCACAPNRCAPAPTGMVSWYPMEGSVNDRLGANNPSASNNVSFVPGVVGQGVTLGSGGYIDIPDSPGLQLQQLTIDAWARPDGPGPTANGSIIVTKNTNANDLSIGLGWTEQSGGHFLFSFFNSGNTSIVSTDVFPAGTFYHVAGTYDGATFRLYVNGVPEGSYSFATTINYNSSIPWVIGANNPPARGLGYPRTWNGVIDEVEIIDRALSDCEVTALYAAGSAGKCSGQCTRPPSGMASWYRMDGSANDQLGANDPSATSAISFVAGEVGQGVTFGAGGFIDIPDSPSLRPQQLTVDAWVRPDGPGPNNDANGSLILNKATTSGYVTSYDMGWRAMDDRFTFIIGDVGSGAIVSTNQFPAGAFYHVAGTYDGATMRLYVNGALQASMALVTTIPYENVPLAIGANPAIFRGIGYPRTWNGVIDEVEVIGRALSANEVAALVAAGSAGKCLCGDGVTDPGEQCDDGNTTNGDGCDNNCTFTACGNGIVTSGEQCDDGNTSNGDCCSSTCQFEPSGNSCPDDGNPCTTEACDGAGTCVHSAGNPGAVCRSAAGDCDVDETCTGTSTACPPDAFQPSSHECRPAAGICDVADLCSGTGPSCPADAKSTALCRPSTADCDAPESCDGIHNDCPPDGVQPATFQCRPPAGPCDAAEFCTGTGMSCPADAKSTGVCRPAATACDVAESCDGSSNNCPPDVFGPDGMTCSDGNRCTSGDHCMAGSCVGAAVPDGTSCNDGNSCTSGDQCVGGSCVASPRPSGSSCDDGNPCTTGDHCNGSGTCVGTPAPTSTPCDDGNACTAGDHCAGGSCIGSPVANGTPCAGGNTCMTAGQCMGGACSATPLPNGASCDDGNTCTSGDQCAGGVCIGTSKPDGALCNDNNSCTNGDQCNAGVCRGAPRPDGAPCGDGNVCATGEACAGGVCVGTLAPDGTQCDDGNECTRTDQCHAGVCAGTPAPDGTSCSDPNTCMVGGQCAAGVCGGNPRPNGASCNDRNACTSGDQCTAGRCAGTPVADGATCSDRNPCTNGDQCSGGSCLGVSAADATPCEDGNTCTSGDACEGGRCTGAPVADGTACGDGNLCTTGDHCAFGFCAGTPAADGTQCSDGTSCTSSDACSGGACIGVPVADGTACTDGCTSGQCVAGTCAGPASPDGTGCSDGNDCTTDDVCSGGVCAGQPATSCAGIDHYLCYKVKPTSPAVTTHLFLQDDFGSAQATVSKPKDLCAPANKNGEGIHDPATHEEAYPLKLTFGQPPQADLTVVDQFATLHVNTLKPDRLLVPTDKAVASPAPPPPPPPVAGAADHYECYKIKITAGSPSFPKGKQATVSDQFQTRLYDVKKPKLLCTPASKNVEGVQRPLANLMCYSVKTAKGQQKTAPVVGRIVTANQLGTGSLDLLKEDLLCVPATRTP